MANYNLQPNEVVLLKDGGVAYGGTFAAYSDELILTNLNLVLIEKGIFGNRKGIRVFPLKQIKVYNGQAQALIGEATNGSPVLEVYFLDGQEKFDFQGGGKAKVLEWTAKINEVLTGQKAADIRDSGNALPGAGLVAEMVKDTVDVFKAKLGTKVGEPGKVAGKCGACSAPISGTRGSTVTCDYCGTAQAL